MQKRKINIWNIKGSGGGLKISFEENKNVFNLIVKDKEK